ncbi:hypothetical protein DRE_00286 [Drechslerella stenobrocha 248]|uniref:Transmembrane protein n=1 Tax=Drechslerella stenobrocha 248 TaxID=1043628 RepID=W7I558_9PEZI|nr:hypothetical protein DRE_00286 [Drechslerella stenobrocha 248]
MPTHSRLLALAVAISSLLVSSTWATLQVQSQGVEVAAKWSASHPLAHAVPAAHSEPRFRRMKRQSDSTADNTGSAASVPAAPVYGPAVGPGMMDDAAVDADATAAAAAAATDATAQELTMASEADMLTSDATAGGTATADANVQSPPASEPEIDVTDNLEARVEQTQALINDTDYAVTSDTPLTQSDLTSLAGTLQDASMQIATLPDPATRDLSAEVAAEIEQLKDRTPAELLQELEIAKTASKTKDMELQKVIEYIAPVLAAALSQNISSPATEGLAPVPITEEPASDVAVAAAAAATAARRRLMRRDLEKRGLWDAVTGVLKVGAAIALGPLALTVAAGASAIFGTPPSPPKEPPNVYLVPQTVVYQTTTHQQPAAPFYQSYQPPPPTVYQTTSQQPASLWPHNTPGSDGAVNMYWMKRRLGK